MKTLKLFKKILETKKPASAMMVVMLMFFAIFILAFGSGYLVFINSSKSVNTSNNMKAYYAALAGKERAWYEAAKNNYDFAGNCANGMLTKVLDNGSSYSIDCADISGVRHFFSVGKYKKNKVSMEIDCIDINKECSDSCKSGSICGGGKLLKSSTTAFIVSPSGCDASGLNCDNSFATADTSSFQWDATVIFQCGNDLIDSRDGQSYRTVQIGAQCWFAQNINYDDGCSLNAWVNDLDTRWCGCHQGNNERCLLYGKLYQRSAAMAGSNIPGIQGICPSGWHVPSRAEFSTLAFTARNLQTSCSSAKALASKSWPQSTTNFCAVGNIPEDNNVSGFDGIWGGSRQGVTGNYTYDLSQGNFLSTDLQSGSIVKYPIHNRSYNLDPSTGGGLGEAYSVRCLKDASSPGLGLIYNGASSLDNGKINITMLAPQTNTYLEASKYCDDLVANGYSDWYLPATNELLALRNDASFPYFNLQSVSNDNYWVSTEQGSTTPTMAGYVKISTGASSYIDKGSEFKVRCVRKDTSCSSKTVCGSSCDYGGESYETVQIGSQCWFKKNLNIGSMINSSVNQSNNSVAEKYCSIDDASNCVAYGGLYQWNEAMQYSTSDGAQGLCPSGWHIPKNSDWTNLTNYLSANSQYWCDSNSAYNAKSLASIANWNSSQLLCIAGNIPETNDAANFSAFPTGYSYYSNFHNRGVEASFWSSTSGSVRTISNSNPWVNNFSLVEVCGVAVRCLKD